MLGKLHLRLRTKGLLQVSSHDRQGMEGVLECRQGFRLGMRPTMQRSMGMKVVQRSHQQVREEHRIEVSTLPTLGIRTRIVRTNQGIRILLERTGQPHCEVEVESTMHRIVEHTP